MDSYILGQLTMLAFVVVIWALFSIGGRMARRDQREDVSHTIRTYREFNETNTAERLRERLSQESRKK